MTLSLKFEHLFALVYNKFPLIAIFFIFFLIRVNLISLTGNNRIIKTIHF